MSERDFTWRVAAADDAELTVTATDDGLVTLAVVPEGPVRLDRYHYGALVTALDSAARVAAGLLAKRERNS